MRPAPPFKPSSPAALGPVSALDPRGPPAREADEAAILARCVDWLERAVIGLNLCPFARAPHLGGRIRWALTAATDTDALAEALLAELERLRASDSATLETTVLIVPHVLQDFADYNAFLDVAEGLLHALGFSGELQIASFHPDYVFEGSDVDDPANSSNRAPFPLLHLLRESSISRVVDAGADVEAIVERNQQRLRELGAEGWTRLLRE